MRFIDDTMLPKSVERKPRAQIFSLPAQALPQWYKNCYMCPEGAPYLAAEQYCWKSKA